MTAQQVVIRADDRDDSEGTGAVEVMVTETAGFDSLAGVYERVHAAAAALAALFPDAHVIDVRIVRHGKAL